MSAPYEIIAGAWTAWTAAANTADIEDLDAAPGGSWTKLGTSGSDNYDEDGITISLDETIEFFRGLGKTGRRKAWRTEEDISVTLKLYDLTAAQLSKALNANAVTAVAAGADVSGAKKVNLYQGHAVNQYALLLRSDSGSPYGDSYLAQIWLPLTVVNSTVELSAVKGEPMGYEMTFDVLYDSTNAFGNIRLQDAVSTS